MKSDNAIRNGTSIFVGIIVAIAAFVRGALLLPLLLVACSVWGLYVLQHLRGSLPAVPKKKAKAPRRAKFVVPDMNLISIEFQDSAGCVPPNLKECAEHFMRRRLAYFHSNKILFSSNYLLDFSKVLTPALYEKWKGILEDLDVAHQVYLYSLCDTNQPVDLRCAFLIELAEPVVEIVKANSPLFESLNPGKQGTSLRDCLRALITTYGSDIFENEINSCFETFLKSLVNSRVRIMHIKRNCSGSYLNGPESVLYSIKISFLYRIVLFNLLGISPSLYHENLISNIQRWNSWNDIMDNLLYQPTKIAVCFFL